MKAMKLSVAIVAALALAAPGTSSLAKDKDKNKDKNKSQSAQHDDRDGHHDSNGKVTICHLPGGDRAKQHTITVGESAWAAHQGHGDYRGACRANEPGPGNNGRFDALDLNDDGVISRREWTGTEDSFDRLDRNDDGVISRREFGR